ncbi:unnamed protein product [Didymodactylos carnosus]|uniref:N-acetylgalactosaminide beta-1,3-galactosyltransferase n=1 Tax=Didymodactylos carnosus TaxID=1234261 RepID=A0A815VLM2_9BILA|nr:unnamed protein product [Didymodactylos carnosus]CAF1530486.1 unnamed protein product [Didymodactylos carnosus]CAF4300153.1 unnamed protein product [Didymodactylos carnosus]CAF4389623.1 unnamed protein product [Didymodactylos carnosus]
MSFRLNPRFLTHNHRFIIYCLLSLLIFQPILFLIYLSLITPLSSVEHCRTNNVRINTNSLSDQLHSQNLNTDQHHISANTSDISNILQFSPRILCWIPTTHERLDRALVIHETWGKRCDRTIFIIGRHRAAKPLNRTIYPFSVAYIGDEKIEKYNRLSEKVLLSLLYLYKRYINEFDWFLKADDDTYVIIENLRHFLRRKLSNSTGYFGFVAKTRDRPYPSGGAGYVLSQTTLLKLGEQILTKPDKRKLCRDNEAEDVNLAYCLARINISVANTRDQNQLETFHPMTFEEHFLGKFSRWVETYSQFDQKKGEKCCSNFTISFHGMVPRAMKLLHFLLYNIQIAQI